MGINGEMRDALEIVRIAVPEIGGKDRGARLAELKPACVDATFAERERLAKSLQPFGAMVVDERPRFDERLGALEIGRDFLARERPARMGHPVARFEIDLAQRTAPATPMVRAAAEIAQPRRFKLEVRIAALRSGIEVLGLAVEIHAAALEKHDADGVWGERQRKRNPGRAAADDRKVGVDGCARRNGAGVDECAQKLCLFGCPPAGKN